MTALVSSPAILYIFGIISNNPWEAVKVVVMEPVWRAPCTVPAAPASLCISTTLGMVPHRLGRPSDIHASAHSPIGEAGVMGYMAMTSLSLYATRATASLPSSVEKVIVVIFGNLVSFLQMFCTVAWFAAYFCLCSILFEVINNYFVVLFSLDTYDFFFFIRGIC